MKLELLHSMGCPFSAKVRNYIDAQGLRNQIEFRDVDEDDAANEKLMELVDDPQVPCLVIDGEPLLESDDIIAWLQANLVEGQKKKAV